MIPDRHEHPGSNPDAPPALRASFYGNVWPQVPGPRAAPLLALLQQFRQAQWQSAEWLHQRQLHQLTHLVRHARRHVPGYAGRLAGLPRQLTPAALKEAWTALPVLERSEVQSDGEALHAGWVPPRHGPVRTILTSGSTGRPIAVRTTGLTQLYWEVLTIREHFWQRRDFGATFAAIRHLDDERACAPDGIVNRGWGAATGRLFRTGPGAVLNIRSTVSEQVEWLRRIRPAYLLSYPSNLAALADHCREHGIGLDGLRQVTTMGEVLSAQVRDRIRSAWGTPVADTYSAQELGYIALQCPRHGHYHVQSENVLVEVLDEQGRPCGPGQTGRVVVTALHNYAMPLIRYAVGDYAEVGEACPCGRGQPVLRRILGRQRNMLRLPGGDLRWPLIGEGLKSMESLPPVLQYQLAQVAPDRIEARLVVARALRHEEELDLARLLQGSLGHPFEIRFTYHDTIPRTRGGKFEEFVSELDPGPR
jgi:phenylacetate-CoA ligase